MEDKEGMAFREIPVFLGNGTEDDKVPIEQARKPKGAWTLLELMFGWLNMKAWDTGIRRKCWVIIIFDFLRGKSGIKDRQPQTNPSNTTSK